MCKPGMWPELLTGGPERDRENARVSVTLGGQAEPPQKQRPKSLWLGVSIWSATFVFSWPAFPNIISPPLFHLHIFIIG